MKNIIKIMIDGKFTKCAIILHVVLAFVTGFLLLHGNDMMRYVFDNLMLQDSDGFVAQLLLVILIFTIVFSIKLFNTYIIQRLTWQGQKRLMKNYLTKLLHSDYMFFTKNETAKIWYDLNFSTQQGASFFEESINILTTFTILTFHAVILFRIDFFTGLLAFCAVPVYFFLTVHANKNFMPLQQKMMEHMGKQAVAGQDALLNVANIKSKNAYNFFIEKVVNIQYDVNRYKQKFNVVYAYSTDIATLVGIVSPILILLGSLQLSDTLAANLGVVLVLYVNIPRFLNSSNFLYQQFALAKSKKSGLDKLREYDNLPFEKSGEMTLTSFESLECKDVVVGFENGPSFTIPNFHIKKGEKVMLVGESGIGKSTVFNIIIGLISDYQGDILINGINLRTIDVSPLRKIFGIAFQNVNSLSATLAENILLDMEKPKEGIDEILELLRLKPQFDIKSKLDLNSKAMSGGEKSRLGLAQILAREFEVLLIDETFSAIDEEMEEEIMHEILDKYARKTIIYIGHRSLSKKFFERIINF